MKSMLFVRFILGLALVVMMLAPFTFLVPKPVVIVTEAEVVPAVVVVPVVASVKIIEQPLHKVDLPDFGAIYDIASKKRQFFDFIRPAIEAKNNQLSQERSELEYWHEQISLGLGLSTEQQTSLQALSKAYRINKDASTLQQIDALLVRVDIIPTSLVLVQAANESAWGTSRFARIGLNFFGIWCYKEGCGMVPSGRNAGAQHEVAAFESVDAAVSGYFNNINKHNAYHVFRTIRAELRGQDQPLDAEILAAGLLPYSERGAHYVLDITDMLRHNQRYFFEPEGQQTALAD
ncbi:MULTISPECIES: glucosaminidase domain-containing protein [Colwellia]|uniref:Glycoside hydrolase family 73 n=1 Tax=Colwellia marinimaniae TaxID=1513592 RepID=A0ABQ0MZN3_9GAMM|nr:MULTISPECIES: glucosaminidase domain-containing protein [Colwellia]GAW97747.1 glycoside hydrolase family 73 [Colwellia marinimaniae]